MKHLQSGVGGRGNGVGREASRGLEGGLGRREGI